MIEFGENGGDGITTTLITSAFSIILIPFIQHKFFRSFHLFIIC